MIIIILSYLILERFCTLIWGKLGDILVCFILAVLGLSQSTGKLSEWLNSCLAF